MLNLTKRRISATLVSAALALASAAASATIITFDGLPAGVNPMISYSESGYTVTDANASPTFLTSDVFGNPLPSIFVADFSSSPFGSLLVTGGGPFVFKSVDTEFEIQPGGYEVSGFLNGVKQFGIADNQAAAVGLAFTTISGNSSLMIDTLRIDIALAGPGSFNVDNINVVAVPEPETYAFMLAGVGVIGLMARRKKR